MAPGNGQWGQDSEEPGRLGDRAGRGPGIFWAEAGGKPDQGRASRERSRIGRGGGAAGARETSGIVLPGAGTGGIRGRGRARGRSSSGGRGNRRNGTETQEGGWTGTGRAREHRGDGTEAVDRRMTGEEAGDSVRRPGESRSSCALLRKKWGSLQKNACQGRRFFIQEQLCPGGGIGRHTILRW